MSDDVRFDSAGLQAFREAVGEEVRQLFGEFQQESPRETFYLFGLFDYVDWGRPSLSYGANTLEHFRATLSENSDGKLPDEYFQWSAGYCWKYTSNLGATSKIEKIIAKTGHDYLVDDAASELQLLVEAEMMLALHDLDAQGVFGRGEQRNGLVLTISTEDEGAADQWRHEISALLLNPEEVFRRFLVEFRRGNRENLTDVDAEIEQLRDTDLARRFLERLAQ